MDYRVRLALWRLAIVATMLAGAWATYDSFDAERGLFYRLLWASVGALAALFLFCIVAFIGALLWSLVRSLWEGAGIL